MTAPSATKAKKTFTIREVLEGFAPGTIEQVIATDLDLPVTGVTSDSREVKPGVVFVAVKGQTVDGHDFIGAAEQAGASFIVAEEIPAGSVHKLAAPSLKVKDSRLALARLASNFYGNPSRRLKMVGVTGTSGKTTTTYLIESILKEAGYQVGVIGTISFRFGDLNFPASHTTPGPVELQRMLAQMLEAGATAVVMEVSSHALKQHRAAYIAFDGVVFTNLSPEHLDFHPDMEDYYRSKAILFKEEAVSSLMVGKQPFAAINADDPYGERLFLEIRQMKLEEKGVQLGSYGITQVAEMNSAGFEAGIQGTRGKVEGASFQSPLVGAFNISNILAAARVTRGMGISPEAIAKGITSLKCVPGRLEQVPNSRGLHVLVDYAHKPDALEKVLKTLSEVKGKHRLITVFGCGGDRDRKKRPVMGRIAAHLSDQVFITADNSRSERPADIIDEIMTGIEASSRGHVVVEADREKAIRLAVEWAQTGDIILIAGKGHEDYQIISDPASPGKTRKIHFDDREEARKALA